MSDLDALGYKLLEMSPAELEAFCTGLGPADMDVVEAALTQPEVALALGRDPNLDWRQNLATFAHHLTRGRFRLWRYTMFLAEKFRQAVTGESIKQIWNLPARYGKSDYGSRWGPAWALDHDASLRLILVSYGDSLARENAFEVRRILREYRATLRVQLRQDRQASDRFLTDGGGGLLASGINATITGYPADGVIFDDPYKGWQEAHSQGVRDSVDNTYKAVVTLRLETERSFVIVIQTRWHEDDQCGRLLKRMEDGTGEAWDLVRIPALAEEGDLLGRRPGEVIEPERFSPAAVKARHLALASSYFIAGLEQQRPAPEEGGEIKRAWWRIEDRMPERADDWITSFDMKLKDKEAGDFVVGQVWARTGKDCWLVDQLRGQYNFATTVNAVALLAVRYPQVARHIIENTGNGPEVMAELRDAKPGYEISEEVAGQLGMTDDERRSVEELRRRGVSGLVANNPKGSKVVRARAVTGQIEAGDVHLPARASWLGAFLDECASFPQGAHDDQVDAMSQALSRLARSQARAKAPKGQLPPTPIVSEGRSAAPRRMSSVMIPRVTR